MQVPFSPIKTSRKPARVMEQGPHCDTLQCHLEYVIKLRTTEICSECMGDAIRMFAELMFGRLPDFVDVPCLPGLVLFF